MKKAPGRSKKRQKVNTAAGRFGRLRAYKDTPATRRSKKFGKYYWQKGLYSRPGHPPFYHGGSEDFNLRRIWFGSIAGPKIKHASGRNKDTYAWRVGPMYRPTTKGTPIPALHEYGGKVKLKAHTRKGRQIVDRGIPLRVAMRENAVYPPRPYMRPSAKEARESAQRKSPHSLKKLTKLGGWKGRRIY